MKKLLLALTLLIASSQLYAQQLNIGTYNLRYANATDSAQGNGWGQRYPVIANVIKFNDLDIFGIQEGHYKMLTALNDSLPGYKWIGVGRDGGQKGEHSAIFYKADKFKLIKTANFWLSPTDLDKPNVGWDAALTRVCTWAQFKEIKTGFTFYFFNVHMDHVGKVARLESSKLIINKIKEFAGNSPVILTGDFNVDQNSEAYAVVNDSGIMKDSYLLSPIKLANNNSFNSFNINKGGTGLRIDHIFVSKQFKVKRYGIITQTYIGKAPSDHYPVVAVLGN